MPRLESPVPVTILSGFLGAGKTTLLNHILSADHGIRAGVLINDFGAINIDAKLVVGVTDDTVDLANGCVCCSIREDLIAACLKLLQRPNPPDILIIETSGVSDPIEVIRTFDLPELQALLMIENLLAVVDAEHFSDLLLEGDVAPLARTQIQAADMVVLNKVDLVDAQHLAQAKEQVRAIAPRSRLLETSHCKVPLELMFGTASGTAYAQYQETGSGHHLSHHAAGDHSEHPFTTWHWVSSQPLSLPKLKAVIEGLPDTVYRAKGIVYLEELPVYRIALQLVGKRYNLRDTELWGRDSPRSEIVVIAARGGINADELQRAFDGCLGTGNEANSPILRLSRRLATATQSNELADEGKV